MFIIRNEIESSNKIFSQLLKKEIERLEDRQEKLGNSVLEKETKDMIKQLAFMFDSLKNENNLIEIDMIVKTKTDEYNEAMKQWSNNE